MRLARETAARLAWGLCAACLVLAAIGLALLVVNDRTAPGFTLGSVPLDAATSALFLAFPVVGALIAASRPRNAIGWLFLATGLAQSLELTLLGYATRGLLVAPGSLPGAATAALVADLVWVPIVVSGIAGLCLLFPHGRLPSVRWRSAVWAGAALTVCFVGATTLKPGPLYYFPSVDNPLGVEGAGAVTGLLVEASGVAAVVLALVAIVSLVARYRASRGQERQQFKWLAYVAALIVASTPVQIVIDSVAPHVKLGEVVFIVLICLLPVAVGIAILRHRLYDVDLVIRRTLVYGVLTATLGAAYLGLVLLIGLAAGDSGVAVAGSTLAVAALFRPARARVQALVDRRFFRRRYDATLTLEAFAARLRDQLDLDAVGGDLRGVVRDTVQPAHVSLWLRRPA